MLTAVVTAIVHSATVNIDSAETQTLFRCHLKIVLKSTRFSGKSSKVATLILLVMRVCVCVCVRLRACASSQQPVRKFFVCQKKRTVRGAGISHCFGHDVSNLRNHRYLRRVRRRSRSGKNAVREIFDIGNRFVVFSHFFFLLEI